MSPTGTPLAPIMAVSGSVSTGPSPASTVVSSGGSNTSSVPTTPGSPNADCGMYLLSFSESLSSISFSSHQTSASCLYLTFQPSTCPSTFPTVLIHSWCLSSSLLHIALHGRFPIIFVAGSSTLFPNTEHFATRSISYPPYSWLLGFSSQHTSLSDASKFPTVIVNS
jgi:hypothetical protein